MRIAYVCADPGVPVFGRKGCSIHVQEVLRAFVRQGARVDLFAARQGGEKPIDLGTIRLHSLPVPAATDPAAREQVAQRTTNAALWSLLEDTGPFDLVYERYSLWSVAGMAYARVRRIPGILEVNAPLIEEQARHRSLTDRSAAERTAERVFAEATALIAVSSGVADYLKSYPFAQSRTHVIPNGVDPDRFSGGVGACLPAPPDTFTVGFVGTLKPWHGLPTLVDAFARLSRNRGASRLLIVGDGPERSSLEADVLRRELNPQVHFTGAVAPAEVPALLASMDVGVAPYPKTSGFYFSPLKVLEYMAAGLPVVASRTGDLPSLIRHDQTGLLVPPGQPAALGRALDRLRADRALATRLGQAARALVLREHTWDQVATRILELAGLPVGSVEEASYG